MAICQMPKYLRFDRTHAKNSSNRQKNIQLDEQWEESQLPPILRVKIIFWSINNRVSKIIEFQEVAKDVQILFFEAYFYPYLVVIIVVATTALCFFIHFWKNIVSSSIKIFFMPLVFQCLKFCCMHLDK